ncbi:retinoic acid receptor alpha isoform X2 [Labeo rohita]|uniref:Retinoic acid receptor alpha isoform X2 n=1 Tax=Labeo rohita TaxID=84645 RepID=A0A498LEX1_LABRO|nr:retinoic acid receptor alpha isoform X2 [Labeo rohita]
MHRGLGLSAVSERAMSGNGNPCPSPGGLGTPLAGFPMPHYPYFFSHMLGGLSPPALPGLPVSGYSTPSPAMDFFSVLPVWMMDLLLAASAWDAPGLGVQPAGLSG